MGIQREETPRGFCCPWVKGDSSHVLTALPAAQSSPPSRLHPAAQQGWALLAWGSGTVVHRAPLSQPLCPHGDVPETPLQHHHSPCSPGIGPRCLLQLQGPRHLSGSAGWPLQAARQDIAVHLMGTVHHLPPSSSPHSAPSPTPSPSKENSWGRFPLPRRLGSQDSSDSGATRDGTPGTSSAKFPSHLWVHPWALLPPLAPWAFPTHPAQGQHPPQGQKPPWHHHSHPLAHLQPGQEHLKGEGSW